MATPLLTPKQKQILDFIQSFSAAYGYAPSQQEIAKHFGFKSLGTVQDYLVRLERQGALQKTWNARRGMQVVPPTTARESMTVPLPLSGRVAAGRPIEAIFDSNPTIDVPVSMIGKGEHFVLQVVGNSMIEDGILDGDHVVIKKQLHAENGQTVVALLGNEATIKTYYGRSGSVELRPANPEFQPIVIEKDQAESRGFRIEGVLVGLIRSYGRKLA